MIVFPEHHRRKRNTFWAVVLVPANQPPRRRFEAGARYAFQYPNVGPFICRQLIQRLVTSIRVLVTCIASSLSSTTTVRACAGDLEGGVRAILMDYDARGVEKSGMSSGRPARAGDPPNESIARLSCKLG